MLISDGFFVFRSKYGTTNTRDPKTDIPSFVKPEFDYWMRGTWVTLGSDGYYYMTGSTTAPNRSFPGQLHYWDRNDDLYLWRSKDMKTWEPRGLIWSLERDGT